MTLILDSIEKLKIAGIKFLLLFGATQRKVDKAKADLKKDVVAKLTPNKFKTMEFKNEGQTERAILNKLRDM
jgi:hypothetical protein